MNSSLDTKRRSRAKARRGSDTRWAPAFDRFLTAEEVAALVGELSLTSHSKVEIAGTSHSGLPIYHVPAGEGSIAAFGRRENDVVGHAGGSCCETERSAQVSVHLAFGARADELLATPGVGVDEGVSIVRNEMQRTLALSTHFKPGGNA